MRSVRWMPILILASLLMLAAPGRAATARVIKVLPEFIDGEGRMALNPSLYERDAYQVYLRKHPDERQGLRFDVQWKSKGARELTLRMELRGNQGRRGTTHVLEQVVRHRGWFATWSKITFQGDAYSKFGELSAWRATLWDGPTQLAEQKSFLW